MMLRKRMQPHELLLGLLTLLGLYLVSQAELRQLTGLLVAVMAAGVCALFSVFNVYQTKLHSPMRLTLYEMGGAWLSVVLFLAGRTAVTGKMPHLVPQPLDWVWLLVLGGICTVYAFSASAELMKRLSAFTVNLTINMEPLYGITLAVLIFGQRETMSTGFYVGTALILLSVLAHPFLSQRVLKRELAHGAHPTQKKVK